MSVESAKKFVNRMQEDKSFAKAMEKLDGKEMRIALLKQEGFAFTMEELISAASEMNAVDVVGGKCCGQTCEKEPCPHLHKCEIDIGP